MISGLWEIIKEFHNFQNVTKKGFHHCYNFGKKINKEILFEI